MLVVETIAKIRRAYFAQNKPIKTICREFRVSRRVVRKVIRSQATEFRYERSRQPLHGPPSPPPLVLSGSLPPGPVLLSAVKTAGRPRGIKSLDVVAGRRWEPKRYG